MKEIDAAHLLNKIHGGSLEPKNSPKNGLKKKLSFYKNLDY